MARIATSVSAYAVSRTRRASGRQLQRGGQELDAGHLRHPLVGDDEGQRGLAEGEAADDVEGGGAGVGGEDRVLRPEVAAELALDGAQDGGLVVDDEDHRVRHGMPPSHLPAAAPRSRRAGRRPA